MAPTGSLKLAILLCKFKNNDTEPFPASFFQDIFITRGNQSLNDYYINASYGAVNFDNSTVFDWKSTSMDRDAFVARMPTSRADRINVAIETHGIKREDYWRVIAIYNDNPADEGSQPDLGVLGWTTAIDTNATFLAHELGHCFGPNDSFDESDRLWIGEVTPGLYWDEYDIMSARHVHAFDHPRWGRTGPLMCAANQDYIGWLPADRVWSPIPGSNQVETVDIVALGHNADVKGPVCVKIDNWYIEFRTRDGFDAGLPRPCVLIHTINSTANALLHNFSHTGDDWDNEWQPGRTFTTTDPALLPVFGGTSVEVISFNLETHTARLQIRHRTARPPLGRFQGPGRVFGGVDVDGGGWIVLPGGHIVPILPRSPVMDLVGRVAIAAQVELMLTGSAREAVARPMYTDIQRLAERAAKGIVEEAVAQSC
jgi:hypothetical protein